jgi:hypothetical protein
VIVGRIKNIAGKLKNTIIKNILKLIIFTIISGMLRLSLYMNIFLLFIQFCSQSYCFNINSFYFGDISFYILVFFHISLRFII